MEGSSGCCRRSSEQLGPGGGDDRISALPDDLLLLVLARLPCAGVLSRRWRGLWARLRRIVFRDVPFHSLETALARVARPPPTVSLLKICLPKPDGRVPKEQLVDEDHLESLLGAAARLDPEEFILVFPSGLAHGSLPCFRRATSIVLDLPYRNDPTIRCLPTGVEFPELETLSLSGCNADFDALLSHCPRLRKLRLTDAWFDDAYEDDLRINSTLLQELVISGGGIYHVNIVAPVLKQLEISIHLNRVVSISVLAPMLEKVFWSCRISGSTKLGFWRVRLSGRLVYKWHRDRDSSLRCTFMQTSLSTFYNDAEKFTQEIERHMIAVLELHLTPHGHVFGALVFHLLGMNRIRCSIRRLKIDLQQPAMKEGGCAPCCPCDPLNWKSQTISLTSLEEVEINGFEGEGHELDLLKLILRCAPMLKKMVMKLSQEASTSKVRCRKIYNIFRAYSSVQCYVYLSSGLVHGSDDCPST